MTEHETTRLDELATRAVDASIDDDIDACICEACVAGERSFRETASLLAAESIETPPFDLRNRVLETALQARPARKPRPDRSTALHAYESAVRRLDNLLRELTPELWDRAATETWNVRELLIHLTVVDRLALEAMDSRSSSILPADVQHLSDVAIANTDVDPAVSRTAWLLQSRALAEVARARPARTVTYLGMPLPSEVVVGDRAFETWLHTQDVRRALGYELEPPAAADLHLLCDLAVRLLPSVSTTVTVAKPGNVRVVLIGEGGGTWIVPVGKTNATEAPSATLHLDPIEFCLLVGNQLDPSEAHAEMSGDVELSRLLLDTAPALSRA